MDVAECVGGKRAEWAVETGEMAVVECCLGVVVEGDHVDEVETNPRTRPGVDAGVRRRVLEMAEVRLMMDLILLLLRLLRVDDQVCGGTRFERSADCLICDSEYRSGTYHVQSPDI